MKKPILLAALGILLATNICNAQNGIITNFAGNSSSGWSGDGGPAIAAGIGNPYGIAFDNSGNMYVVDINHGVVRKINTAGIITTIAGNGTMGYSGDGGPATAAKTDASNIAVDALGNVYIADGNNDVVRKVNTSGIITTIAGIGGIGYSGDGGPATAAQIGNIFGIAVDATGNVYLSDFSYNVVRKVSASGIITTLAGNGTGGYSGDGGPATAAQLYYPRGLVADASGNVYIGDITNNRIRKVNATGIISTVAGIGTGGFTGDGGPAIAAEINKPWYLSISGTGDICFTDVGNNRVRKINASGIISTIAGIGTTTCSGIGGLAINASIQPIGIGIDQAQNVYVSDDICYDVYKVSPAPSIVSDSFSVYINNLCNGLNITAVAHSSSTLNLNIFFGDNSSVLSPLSPTMGGYESVNRVHSYAEPGTYSIKMVLLNGTTPIDSVKYSYHSLLCNTLPVSFYYDANSNCIKDSTEPANYIPITIEVDSNSIAIDTISATSGFDYTAYGNPGDIYSFRVLSLPAGMFASCSSGGVITDTLQIGMYNTSSKNMALSCNSGSSFDLAEYVMTQSGRHLFTGDIIVNNTYCNSVPATLTTNLDPKYNFVHAVPAPTSITGNTITWNLGSVAATLAQVHINFSCEVSGTWLTPGDTVNTDYTVNPTTGDSNPVNNYCVRTDTVKSSFDPNEMSVTPAGIIPSGTQLQYTIEFENTGNDTAHNIYVMDTLSSNVIPSSLRMLASSAAMDIIPIKAGGYNIVKFDFPNIQLLDSSHHNQCNGIVMFTINTRTGLPNGATIFNHAGIFFDDNPVVMTNTVEDIIYTEGIATISNSSKTSIYPNPATDELTIKIDKDAYNSFTITNSVGQVFMQQQLTVTQTTVNVKTLPAGLYYITLRGDNGTKVQKFVKM